MGAEETRQAILDAARSLFAEKGYTGTTMLQIAHRVGITDAAIYRHFQDKRELFVACATRQLSATSEPWLQQLRAMKDLRSLMRTILKTRLDLMETNRDLFDIFFKEGRNFPEVLEAMLRRLDPSHEMVAGVVDMAKAEMRRPLNPLISGIGIWAMVWAIVTFQPDVEQIRNMAPEIPWSQNDLLDDLVDFVMYGMAGEPPATGK